MAPSKAVAVVKAPKTPKPKKEEAVSPTIHEIQAAKLTGIKSGNSKLVDLMMFADSFPTMDLKTVPSGFAILDRALVPDKPGVPLGRHIEVASDQPNIGKSTLTMQIVAAFQLLGLQACLCEPEATHTEVFLNSLGVVTRFDPKRPWIYPLRIMRPEWDKTSDESILHSAEAYLDAMGHAVDIFDIIVVDSAAALVGKADWDKDAEESPRVGGISKLLHGWFRKHLLPKASVFWVNQLLDKVGGFSPGGGTPKATTGGKAIPFYSSVRLFGSRIEAIKAPVDTDDPIGFWVQWELKKNKLGPQDRKIKLPFLHGEGYSVPYALFDFAVSKKVIGQGGAWYTYPPTTGAGKDQVIPVNAYGFLRAQGRVNFYEAMRTRPDTCEAIKAVIRGEDPEDLRPLATKEQVAELIDQVTATVAAKREELGLPASLMDAVA